MKLNREKLIRMAHESGFDVESWVTSVGCEVSGTHEELERFAAMIVRECVEISKRTGILNGAQFEGEMIADAITERFGI